METKEASFEYAHRELGEEITAIGGHYSFTAEKILPLNGRKILYLVGYALMDTSCCGATGCAFAQVQGFITRWHHTVSPDGVALSDISPVRGTASQEEIARMIKEKEIVQQVMFRTGGE